MSFNKTQKAFPLFGKAFYNFIWVDAGAITSLRKARVGWPTIAKVHFELGYVFEKTNMTDSAIKSYNTCLLYKDDYSLAYKQLGNISYLKEEYEKSLLYFTKYEAAAKTSITDYLHWYRKGFMYNAQKNHTFFKKDKRIRLCY